MIIVENNQTQVMRTRSLLSFLLLMFFGCITPSSFIVRDINSFTRNSEVNYTSLKEYFIPLEKLLNVKLGNTEEEVYKVIYPRNIYNRFTYKQVLAKRLKKLKYIPVTKSVSFYGVKAKINRGIGFIEYEPVEELGVAFFFYRERLIYIAVNHRERRNEKWIQLQDSSEEVLFADKNRNIEEPLSIIATNAAGDAKFYGFVNGYLGEKLSNSGERSFYPTVPLDNPRISNILVELSEQFTYWEESEYEKELQKSGYYKLKAKLDKEFENKTGYWKEQLSK